MTAKKPYIIDVQAGKPYGWCACGLSQKQPFCDGSHRGNSDLKSLLWQAPESKAVVFCGCKKTKTPPFCDGSHNKE